MTEHVERIAHALHALRAAFKAADMEPPKVLTFDDYDSARKFESLVLSNAGKHGVNMIPCGLKDKRNSLQFLGFTFTWPEGYTMQEAAELAQRAAMQK